MFRRLISKLTNFGADRPKAEQTPDDSRRTVNAVLDPLGRPSLSASELSETFNILRADRLFNDLGAFESFDTLEARDPSLFFGTDDVPEAVIFISHRWEDQAHPDPTGRKFVALQKFLEMIRQVSDWRADDAGPSATEIVMRHGAYQATYFLGDYNRFNPDAVRPENFGVVGAETLRRVGIWFDFSCLSQSPETVTSRKEVLSRLHDLLGAANLLSFREPGDTYDYRGWCAAELSIDPDIARSRVRKICLRLDKLGDQLDVAELANEGNSMASAVDMLLPQLATATSGKELVNHVSLLQQFLGVAAEDDRETPLLFNRRGPYVFADQEAFMTAMIHALDNIEKMEEPSVDLLQVVVRSARNAGLQTTEEEDLAFTSLMILYARHRGAPDLARLYGECLGRWIDGRSTCLVAFTKFYDERDGWKLFNGRCTFAFKD